MDFRETLWKYDLQLMISAQYPTAVFIKHDDEVLGAITGGNLLASCTNISCSRSIMYHGMGHQLNKFPSLQRGGLFCVSVLH